MGVDGFSGEEYGVVYAGRLMITVEIEISSTPRSLFSSSVGLCEDWSALTV